MVRKFILLCNILSSNSFCDDYFYPIVQKHIYCIYSWKSVEAEWGIYPYNRITANVATKSIKRKLFTDGSSCRSISLDRLCTTISYQCYTTFCKSRNVRRSPKIFIPRHVLFVFVSSFVRATFIVQHTHTHTHTHARARARAHTRTHTGGKHNGKHISVFSAISVIIRSNMLGLLYINRLKHVTATRQQLQLL